LVNNGGPTPTHALLPTSLAIDKGDELIFWYPPNDQRGEPFERIVDGDGSGPPLVIDIGALEAQTNLLPGDYNYNGSVDAADYTVWRDTKGSTTDLRADGSGPTTGVPDGVVDDYDYAFWKSHIGDTLPPPGSGALAEVAPETTVAETESGTLGASGTLGTAALIVDDVATEAATPVGDTDEPNEPVSTTARLARLSLAFAEFSAADDAAQRPNRLVHV
jgi:hypothetical protein